jgi:hypothetical protein
MANILQKLRGLVYNHLSGAHMKQQFGNTEFSCWWVDSGMKPSLGLFFLAYQLHHQVWTVMNEHSYAKWAAMPAVGIHTVRELRRCCCP